MEMPSFLDQKLVEMTSALAVNFSIILCGIVIFTLFLDRQLEKRGKAWEVGLGLGFGLLTIISMLSPIAVREGIIIDAKYPLTLISTIFGGPLSGLLTLAISGMARIVKGGMGVYAAIPTLFVTWLTGMICLRYDLRPTTMAGRLQLYVFLGAILWLYQFLGGFVFLFFRPWSEVLPILFDRSLPALILYPPTTLLLGLSLDLIELRHNQRLNSLRSETRYHHLFDSIPLCIHVIRKSDRALLFANAYSFRYTGKAPEESIGQPLALTQASSALPSAEIVIDGEPCTVELSNPIDPRHNETAWSQVPRSNFNAESIHDVRIALEKLEQSALHLKSFLDGKPGS